MTNQNQDISKETIFNTICLILSKQLGIPSDTIKLEHSLMGDLGADDLDIVEIIMTCEESFNIEIPAEAEDSFHTVADFVEFIAQAKLLKS